MPANMMRSKLWWVGVLALVAASAAMAVACGGGDDDDDDDSGGSADGKGICTFKSCVVTCTYEPLEPEYNDPVTIPHEVGDGKIVASEGNCTSENLYKVFEGHIWEGDYTNACPDLDEGFESVDPETGIDFECDSVDFEAAE